jgi:hypothetical protein
MHQRWLWSPPQVNESVYSDAYYFKLDLVLLIRLKLGPSECWPLIPRTTICCTTDYVRNEVQATPANSLSQNIPHKMQNADPSGRAVYSGSVATRLLGLRVRIPPEAWMSVSCVCVGRCEVGVSAKGRSLIQMNPTECGVSLSEIGCNVSL